MDAEFHKRHFARLADELAGYTERCVISFWTSIEKQNGICIVFGPLILEDEAFLKLRHRSPRSSRSHGLNVETCAEDMDLTRLGIQPGKCIDDQLIERIIGHPLVVGKDPKQRPACGCVSSIDTAYNTCTHGCLYCYANYSKKTVERNIKNHDLTSTLIGHIQPTDTITEREMVSLLIAR